VTRLAGVGVVADGLGLAAPGFAPAGLAAAGVLDDPQPATPTIISPVNATADVRAKVIFRRADTGVSSRLGGASGPRWTCAAGRSFDGRRTILDRLTRNGSQRQTGVVAGSQTVALIAVVVLAVGFDATNGFHDSSNSVAAPVATHAMRPSQAVSVAAVFTVLGPILAGTAVADTVGGLVRVGTEDLMGILVAALIAAVTWNLATWRWGLPSSSSHALVGGLVGAAVVVGGAGAVRWGGFEGVRPVGVVGVLVALAVSPLLGAAAGWLLSEFSRRGLRRAHRRVTRPILRSEWGTAAALSFAHGTNDAQKTMGIITLALVSTGTISSFVVPLWVKLVCAIALTVGTALGGWRIAHTIGRGIYRIRPLDGLVSQGSSTLVIGGAAMFGAPVSTTHVLASSVVGVGVAGRRRHVHWAVVQEIALAWLVTLPACASLAAGVSFVARMGS